VIVADPDTPPNAVYFQVPAGEQRVVFLLPWSNFNDEVRVGWRPAGTNGSFTLAVGAAVVVSEKRGGHGIIGVDLAQLPPGATDWRVQHLSGAVAQPLTDADVVAVRDLRTAAEISFDRAQYFIGDPIRLTCSIRSGGASVTGTTVAVDSARPGEGLGTFLATNSGRIQRDQEGRSRYKPDHSGDPDHGKGLMFKTLLQITGKSGLSVIDDTGLMLLDDGAHGDGVANDGNYSNEFTDTLKEGTYTFRFRISGQLPDGSPFSRLFTRSTWVGVRADPSSTYVAWQIGAIVNGLQQATLTIKPQTATGELLGPYRQDVFGFKVWSGALVGDLVDHFDGSYTQTISYGVGDRPTVIPEVYGEPLHPTGPTDDHSGEPGCVAALLATPRAILRWIKNLLS